MIVNKYANGGGGSGSGVTPEQVQQQIDSALTPYWDSAVTESAITEAVSGLATEGYVREITSGLATEGYVREITSGLATEQYVQDALSGVNMDNYYTSAQTEDAISAATSGKADAANLSPADTNHGDLYFPKWNEQGIITGKTGLRNFQIRFDINGIQNRVTSPDTGYIPSIYAPSNAGTAGDILVSTGNGAPVWSAVTMPDMSEYTPTSGFSTINGSAITNGGNIVIEGGADMSAYYTSAQTEDAISAATSGKADKANVLPNYGALKFPAWNADGIIGGEVSTVHASSNFYLNGTKREPIFSRLVDAETRIDIYAPQSAGNAGDILVSTGNGAPVWSAVTMPDMAAYTPTSGFSTINGSAITNGGNIVIEGGADMSAYYTSAQTDAAIAQAVSGLATEQYVQDALSGVNMDNYYTSAQTKDAISAATDDMKTYTDNRIDGYDSAVTLTRTPQNKPLKMNGSNVYEADEVGWEALGSPWLFTTNMQQYDLGNAPGDPNLGRPNYAKFNFVAETDSTGREFTGVYYALPANGEFIEGVPVQLTRTTSVPETIYNTPALTAGTGYYIWDNVNLTITWKRQPVIEQHVPGVATEQYVQDALSGVNMDNYYTSAQTEDAISAATSGKADALNINPNTGGKFSFPRWNSQGIITGEADGRAYQNTITINGASKTFWGRGDGNPAPFYAPLSAGTAGDILVSTGNGAPVWTTDNKVSSTSVSTIWRGTQSDYDAIVDKDPNTFYIIVSN